MKDEHNNTASTQAIRIMGFVDGDVIPPSCYDKPYCLEPSKRDGKAYEVLRDVMHRSRKVGLAAVVIEKKQALAAIVPIGRTLVLNVLRLATSLVPGKRVAANATANDEAKSLQQVASASAPRRRATLVVATTSKPAARISARGKQGEVIDLAVRRSTKRATQGRTAKPARGRTATVATLHQLRRKNPAPRTPGVQLA